MTIRFGGRRLRPIRMSPVATAIGLALVVVAFVGVLASALAGVPALGVVGWLAGAGAIALVGRHTWIRLTARGKVLFGLPVALVFLWCVLAAFALPGADIVGYAAFSSWTVAIGFGVVGRAAPSAQLSLAKATVEPSLLRAEAPAERIRVVLDERGVSLEGDDPASHELWATPQIASARLGRGRRPILRITDRIGDDVAVEVEPEDRAEVEELVRHLEARRAEEP